VNTEARVTADRVAMISTAGIGRVTPGSGAADARKLSRAYRKSLSNTKFRLLTWHYWPERTVRWCSRILTGNAV
jgi:hypothetical protein